VLAAVSRRYGPPDVVTVAEVPRPEPRDDEILVRVRAAAVGVVDGLARRGSPWYARAHFGPLRPRFPVLGCDFAGDVEAAGPAVSRFGAGEAVFGTIAPRFGAHAEYVVDYTRTDFTRAGRRYDVIFDVAGTSSFGRCRRALNPGGVYLTTAPSPAIIAAMPWTARFGARRAVVAFTGLRPASEKQRDLLVIKELAEASALVPVVGAYYPLTRIADAYRHVDAGHKKGTIVVTMS
jgi:NADPH:quinone reductase-like Zn-dependent oxidoreductase